MRFLWVLLSTTLCAQDWGSLHILNAEFAINPKLNVQLHSRLRTNENFKDYFQARGGPILFYKVVPRLTMIGGYYFIDEETSAEKRNNFHRLFTGFIWHVPTSGKVKLEARSLIEEFIAVDNRNFLRVRERLWLTLGTGKIRPYAQVEGFSQRGALTGRFGLGFNFKMSGGRELLTGYEFRQLPSGGRLQLITSNYQFNFRGRKN